MTWRAQNQLPRCRRQTKQKPIWSAAQIEADLVDTLAPTQKCSKIDPCLALQGALGAASGVAAFPRDPLVSLRDQFGVAGIEVPSNYLGTLSLWDVLPSFTYFRFATFFQLLACIVN